MAATDWGTAIRVVFLLITIVQTASCAEPKHDPDAVRINKCCEKNEILVDLRCETVNSSVTSTWSPVFTGYDGVENVQVNKFYFAIGMPDCGPMQMWPIYHYYQSADKLILLPDGKLRHYIKHPDDDDDFQLKHLDQDDPPVYYDYNKGHYCMDKSFQSNGELTAQFAMVCTPEKVIHWTDTGFLVRKIINPICHGISMIVLLVIAIIYFVLPTLRDLVGNIVTTITLCLILSQAANLVRIFTDFSSHVNFMVADIILNVGLLGAFFWLNSLGYYIWKTFRSRNVFLRVTDGSMYCWYSIYAWSATAAMAGLAVFGHFFLESKQARKLFTVGDQETIGWLGIAIFFTPIAFTIIVDIFFYVTTVQIINRMTTYGRIHHKLKANFVMYSLMLIVMSITWLSLVFSWLNVDDLLYLNIICNAMQAPLLLYICVLRQQNVKYLLKKSCCYNEPPSPSDWGDEMAYMNGGEF